MNIRKPYCAVASALVLAAGTCAAAPALAQQGATAGDAGLEEIMVTARKRDENLQDVPISITAFTADSIERRGIESVYDIAKLTPNLSFNQTYGRVFDRPVIRGMSQILGERTVSFVVDGVYIAGNITGADLDDLESVEVLKGPQAANFGRGSLAGVISYRTTRPSNEFMGKASASYGDDGFKEISANVSGPLLGDTLTFKLGGRFYEYDGQYTGRSSDGRSVRFGAEETKRVSGALRWAPTDAFDVTLRAFAAQNSDGLYNNIISKTLNCFQTAPGARGGSFCGEIPTIPQNGGIGVDLADIERQGQPGVEQDSFLYSLEANWDVGPGTATALVSWNRQDEDWIIDDYLINSTAANLQSQVPSPTMTVENPGNITRLINLKEYQSQELRFASNTEGKVAWLVGLYNYEQENTGFNGGPRYNINLANGMAAATNTGPVGTLRQVSQPVSPFEIENQAVFASVSYDPTDRWHLTLEGRYAKDQLTTNNAVQVGGNCARVLEAEFKSFTPRGTVRFDFTEDLNAYFSVARGNKPGDFNSTLCSAAVPANEFQRLSTITPLSVDEESSVNYEFGTKMRLLDGRMSLDAAVFFTDWSDQQVTGSQVYTNTTGMGANISLTTNAGKTEIKGLEINWRWKLNDMWDVNASYGYTDAKFEELCDNVLAILTASPVTTTGPCPSAGVGVLAAPVNFANAAGFRTANAPGSTGTVGAEFRVPVGTEWSFFARADYSYQGERFAEVYNHASTGTTTRLDARLGAETDAWKVTLWGRNLGDDRSPDSVVRFFDPDAGFAFTRAYQVHFPNGRQYGLTASYKF
jgi:iron complex outermembrane receptor protein